MSPVHRRTCTPTSGSATARGRWSVTIAGGGHGWLLTAEGGGGRPHTLSRVLVRVVVGRTRRGRCLKRTVCLCLQWRLNIGKNILVVFGNTNYILAKPKFRSCTRKAVCDPLLV